MKNFYELAGVSSRHIQTQRLNMHLLSKGAEDATPVLFIHGNFASSVYFEELMAKMPNHYRSLAVDLRGYGDSEDKLIDASRGARDWADDLYALLQSLNIEAAHLVGWSAGAAAVMQFALDHPQATLSMTLIAPVSPYGFGGSRDPLGSPCHKDYAGSGGGLVAQEFIERIAAQDRSREQPLSPYNVIQHSYFYKPVPEALAQILVDGSLKQKTGAQRYPGDSATSLNWPYLAPGKFGPLNAVSGKYLNLEALITLPHKPPVLWVRGDKDIIIDDRSFSDPAVLGEQDHLADWPGPDVYPPQPMLEQTRNLLQRYRDNGGYFREEVISDVGHSPFIENQALFLTIFLGFLAKPNCPDTANDAAPAPA